MKKRAIKIDSENKTVHFQDGTKTSYDKLLITTGSSPFLPPIQGVRNPSVMTLRTLSDAKAIIDKVKDCKNVVVIGGGLLGIENANSIRSKGVNVTIIEYFPRLLPRQLDIEGAGVLKHIIEAKGIQIVLGVATESITDVNGSINIKVNDGREFQADLAVISAGVRPNIGIAKDSGIEYNRGIVVNEYMETNIPDVYAAGDVAECQNKCWGIIPAAFPQARVAALNMTQEKKEKIGEIIPSNTLKVADIDLTSVGTIYFEKKPEDVLEYRFKDSDKGIYKKIVIKDNLVIGAIMLGDTKNLPVIMRIIRQKINVEKFKEKILDPEFNLSKI